MPVDRDLAWLRWALVLALAYLILVGTGGEPSVAQLGYVALLLASNAAFVRVRLTRGVASVLVLDTVLVGVGLLLCDGATQDLLIAYFLCVLMAALTRSEGALAGAGFLVAGAYAAWTLQQPGPQEAVWIRLPFLFVATVFYGYLMQQIRSERGGRRAAEQRTRALDTLLQVTRSFASSLATTDILERVATTIRASLEARDCHIRLVPAEPRQILEPDVVEALSRRTTVHGRLLALPIVWEEELLGALVVESAQAHFTDEQIELCEIVAHAAAPALKNARQYEALAGIERRKGELVTRFSHELRTPLTAISICSDLAAEEAERAGSISLCENVAQIARSAGELANRIGELAEATREELCVEPTHVERIDLRELVACSLQKTRELADGRAVEFDVAIDPGNEEIYANRSQIERILENLLAPVVRYSSGSKVRISALVASVSASAPQGRPWERMLTMSVQDPGARFDPRPGVNGVPRSRRDATFAASLDLARRLARRLRGSVEVRSVPNDGACLRFLVPVEVRAHPTP